MGESPIVWELFIRFTVCLLKYDIYSIFNYSKTVLGPRCGIGLFQFMFITYILFRFTCSDWPFQLDATSDLVKNRARVRKAGSNASIWKAIDNKQTQKEHVLNGQSGSGVLPRQFLKEEDLRYELPLTDIRLTVDIAASTVRLIGRK